MSRGIPIALQPVNLFTKPHYHVITFVISEQTLSLANPLCYRAAHPSLRQELTSKGIKRRRRLPEGSFELSFYSCWLPPPFLFRDVQHPSPLIQSFSACQASICSCVVLMELEINVTLLLVVVTVVHIFVLGVQHPCGGQGSSGAGVKRLNTSSAQDPQRLRLRPAY